MRIAHTILCLLISSACAHSSGRDSADDSLVTYIHYYDYAKSGFTINVKRNHFEEFPLQKNAINFRSKIDLCSEEQPESANAYFLCFEHPRLKISLAIPNSNPIPNKWSFGGAEYSIFNKIDLGDCDTEIWVNGTYAEKQIRFIFSSKYGVRRIDYKVGKVIPPFLLDEPELLKIEGIRLPDAYQSFVAEGIGLGARQSSINQLECDLPS